MDFKKLNRMTSENKSFCGIPLLRVGFLTPFLLPRPRGVQGEAKTGQAVVTGDHGDFCR